MKQTQLAKEFTDGWKHFLDRIDFGSSHLDAEAIQFMNEMPGRLVNSHDGLVEALTVLRGKWAFDVVAHRLCLNGNEVLKIDKLLKALANAAKKEGG